MIKYTSELSVLDIYQSDLIGCDLFITESTATLQLSQEKIKRLRNLYRVFFIISLLCFFCTMASIFRGKSETLVISLVILTGVFLLSALFFRLLLPLHTVAHTLDLASQCFHSGKRTLLFSDIKSVIVRRNTHNERYRLGVVELMPDEKLRDVRINIKFKGRVGALVFGAFKSTAVAVRYCNQLVEIIGFAGDVKIDGQQKK